MKAIKVILAALAATAIFASCNTKVADDVDPTTVKNPKDLLSSPAQIDSVSYLAGVWLGSWIKGNGLADEKLSELNLAKMRQGMNDFFKATTNEDFDPSDSATLAKFWVDPNLIGDQFNKHIGKVRTYKAEIARRKGVKFLENNLKNEGVDTTASGLQYKILSEGAGVCPGPRDTVVVKYKGTTIDGKVFDENEEIEFPLNGVIPGWTEGFQLLKIGTEAILYIPSELGYGSYGTRGIGPNEVLIFEVTLKNVKPYVEKVVEEEKK